MCSVEGFEMALGKRQSPLSLFSFSNLFFIPLLYNIKPSPTEPLYIRIRTGRENDYFNSARLHAFLLYGANAVSQPAPIFSSFPFFFHFYILITHYNAVLFKAAGVF
jgi:hypothetical protein